MKISFALFLVLASACIGMAADATNQAVPVVAIEGIGDLMSSCEVRGKSYDLNLPPKRLASAPAWTMKAGEEPSVSCGRAVLLAREQVLKTFADGAAWVVQRIWIERFPEPAEVTFRLGDRWFYEVSFLPPEVKEPQPDEYRVYVLMDGSVVAPVERRAQNTEPPVAPNAAPPRR